MRSGGPEEGEQGEDMAEMTYRRHGGEDGARGCICKQHFSQTLGTKTSESWELTDGADGVEEGSAEADAFVLRPFIRSKQK